MILDIGCGINPRGHINTDIQAKENYEITQLGKIEMNPKTTPNFIICSGEFLPFRNRTFELVYSHHVIEHVNKPHLFLSECKRVSDFKIIIVCPHRYGKNAYGKNAIFHKHVFSSLSWKNTDFSVKTISNYRCFPSKFIPLIKMPDEWTIEFYRRR